MNNETTYCPQDNKLRLYVGRVPREEYLALRAQGWTSTPKQDCDFAATWTPEREDTALEYAGTIGDEDQSPADRAADRAERFAGYRDKRTVEAIGHADSYDAGPSAHGFQSKAKATRAADRHDKQASRAVSQWDKASYWTQRTAGVIANALYLDRPDVRMGRIKKLETELRRYVDYTHEAGVRWCNHTKNRLTYEEAMLEAVGGRASVVTMEKGGTYAGLVISRVTISKASGNATSLKLISDGKEIYHNIERSKAGQYEAPTEESKAALAEFVKARAAAAKLANAGKPKLLNPTLEDAERLQKIWNANAKKQRESSFGAQLTGQTVLKLTQAQYSANSKGSYAHCRAIELQQGGAQQRRAYYRTAPTAERPTICKVRQGPTKSDGTGYSVYGAYRVIHITDKPGKPLPAETWLEPIPLTKEEKSNTY